MCQFCDLYIRSSGDQFSIAVDPKANQPLQSWEEIPSDGKVFTFEYKAQAREWYHRREWERMWFGNPREQLRLTREEKEWVEFHAEMRERIDAKKGEIERLLQSDIMKNVTHGLDIHGFRVSESREIYKEGASEPFCGLGGGLGEGLDRATLMIAIFELYLEYAHAQDSKRRLKDAEREEESEARRVDTRDLGQ
jgi:hypothetical protein